MRSADVLQPYHKVLESNDGFITIDPKPRNHATARILVAMMHCGVGALPNEAAAKELYVRLAMYVRAMRDDAAYFGGITYRDILDEIGIRTSIQKLSRAHFKARLAARIELRTIEHIDFDDPLRRNLPLAEITGGSDESL